MLLRPYGPASSSQSIRFAVSPSSQGCGQVSNSEKSRGGGGSSKGLIMCSRRGNCITEVVDGAPRPAPGVSRFPNPVGRRRGGRILRDFTVRPPSMALPIQQQAFGNGGLARIGVEMIATYGRFATSAPGWSSSNGKTAFGKDWKSRRYITRVP